MKSWYPGGDKKGEKRQKEPQKTVFRPKRQTTPPPIKTKQYLDFHNKSPEESEKWQNTAF